MPKTNPTAHPFSNRRNHRQLTQQEYHDIEVSERTFHQRLNDLIAEREISQNVLARGIDVSHQTVSAWTNGLHLPQGRQLLLLSAYFGVTLDWLLAGDEE